MAQYKVQGKTRQRSLRISDSVKKSEAESLAAVFEVREKEIAAIPQEKLESNLSLLIRGLKLYAVGELTTAAVTDLLEEASGAECVKTLEQFAAERREAYRGAESTRKIYARQDALIMECVPGATKLPIRRISGACVESLLDRLLTKGLKASYINQVFARLKSLLRAAVAEGYATRNAADRVKPLASDADPKAVFTEQEYNKLLMAAEPEMQKLLKFAWATGMRTGDILNINKGAARGGFLHFRPSKTQRNMVRIPLSEELTRIVALSFTHYIFPDLREKSGSCAAAAFNRLMKRAGVEKHVEVDGVLVGRSLHTFRHTFITRLAEAGVAEDVRMRLAGHSSVESHKLYNHGEKDLREAIEKIS